MTTDEIRDELARLKGWNKPGTPIPLTKDWRLGTAETQSFVYGHWWKAFGETTMRQWDHPYPPTLDGANAAVPEGWTWGRFFGVWSAQRVYPSSTLPKDCNTTPVEVIDHGRGHEMDDLYTLALACVRAEEKR